MGQWFKFVCDECGYAAEVSGGPDAGMLVAVQTMSCTGCRNMVDVVIATHAHDEEEDVRLQRSLGRCPKCRRKTGLDPWGKVKSALGSFKELVSAADEPKDGEIWGLCPRCGAGMRSRGANCDLGLTLRCRSALRTARRTSALVRLPSF